MLAYLKAGVSMIFLPALLFFASYRIQRVLQSGNFTKRSSGTNALQKISFYPQIVPMERKETENPCRCWRPRQHAPLRNNFFSNSFIPANRLYIHADVGVPANMIHCGIIFFPIPLYLLNKSNSCHIILKNIYYL